MTSPGRLVLSKGWHRRSHQSPVVRFRRVQGGPGSCGRHTFPLDLGKVPSGFVGEVVSGKLWESPRCGSWEVRGPRSRPRGSTGGFSSTGFDDTCLFGLIALASLSVVGSFSETGSLDILDLLGIGLIFLVLVLQVVFTPVPSVVTRGLGVPC